MNSGELPLNAVCVDTSALAKTAFVLNKNFKLIEFLGFCSLIEQIVLRDALILTGSANAAQKNMLDSIQRWLISDAIIMMPERPRRVKIPSESIAQLHQLHPDLADPNKTGSNDAAYETGRLIAAQNFFNRPAFPLARNFRSFDRLVRPDICQMVFDLVAQYDEQVQEIQRLKIYANQYVPNYVQIDFPPIAIEVLKQSESFSDLVKLTLQYRAHFSEIRRKIVELDEIQRDPSISAKKKLSEINGWVQSWNENLNLQNNDKLILGTTATGFISGAAKMASALTTSEPVSIFASVDDLFSGGGGMVEAIKAGAKYITQNRNDRLLQPIRSAFMGSLYTSQPEITAHVDRIFSYDPRKYHELLRVATSNQDVLSALVDNEMKVRLQAS